jgi:hypothetical protein
VFHGGVMELYQYYCVLLYYGDITAYYCDSIKFPGRPKTVVVIGQMTPRDGITIQ